MSTSDTWAPLTDPDTWRTLLSTSIRDCRVEPLAGGNSASTVTRVHMLGGGPVPSVVVKQSLAPWADGDPSGFRREAMIYQRLLHNSSGIAPTVLHVDEAADAVRLVLEDLQPAFAFRHRDHRWTRSEVRPCTDALARLHAHTHDNPGLDDELLMAAPDRRWPEARVRAAASELDQWVRDQGPANCFSDGVTLALARCPAQSMPAQSIPVPGRCLVHSDFNTGNIALRDEPADARLLDWHIAAAAGPGFDLANLFFQPWNNHLDLAADHVLDCYDSSRRALDLDPWYATDRGAAFDYALTWCALSYLPPIADHVTSHQALAGWWLNTARSALRALHGQIPIARGR